MAMITPVALFKSNLTNKITSTATTIYVDSFTNLTNGLVYGFIIDEGLSTEEFVLGTVDTATSSLTSVTRGVSVADGITSVTANKSAHPKNAEIKITSHPYLVKIIRVLEGTDDFESVPKLPSSRTISNARDIVDKQYADAVGAAAGGITAFYVEDGGGTTVDIGAGRFVTADGTVNYAGTTGLSLTDDQINYVELNQTGTAVANITGWTTGYVPLAKVTCASGAVSVVEDARGWLTLPSGDVLVTDDATYGATIAAGDLLFLDTADSKWKLADGSAEATCDGQLGVALDAGSDTNTNKRVQIGGLVDGLTGLTAGWAYVSDTAGDISDTAGTYKKICGYAISATQMVLIQFLSADELSGGNSDLTVANLNEAGTFFGSTDISGAEAETLTDGSDANSLHTHSGNITTIELTCQLPAATFLAGDSSTLYIGFNDEANAPVPISAATYGPGSPGSSMMAKIGINSLSGLPYAMSPQMDGPVENYSVVYIGSNYWTSEKTSIEKNGAYVTISGTAPSSYNAPLGYDPTNEYLLVMDTTTTIHRYSGVSGTTITYVDEITLSKAVTKTGFLYDNANQQYYCIDGNDVRIFNASGTSLSATAIPNGSLFGKKGLVFFNDRLYVVSGFATAYDTVGTIASSEIKLQFIPLAITR